MNKSLLQNLVEQAFSQRDIAEKLGKSQSSIKYWLKKHELKTKLKPFNLGGTYKFSLQYRDNIGSCKDCGETGVEKFYRYSNGGLRNICNKCHALQSVERFRKRKQEAVDYKGGHCLLCGYNRCNSSLDFHHSNPNEKDPDWKLLKNRALTENVKKELDKCILVCKNCHGEIHAGWPGS
jgi:hypothetical protein